MFQKVKSWRAQSLPYHPKKHHKPFRWRHLAIFAAGIALGFFGAIKSGYINEKNYDINTVSPATVKIYHFVCGTLTLNGQTQGEEVCDGGAGSGFLVSSDGYVATSGHVVVRRPADILVNQLRKDPNSIIRYAQTMGIPIEKLYQEGGVNSLLKSVYDLPVSQLSLQNKKELTLVAVGDRPIVAKNQQEIKQLFDLPNGDYIKKATVVASDYEPKDLLSIEEKNSPEGFSANDVALIKIDTKNAPFINLADTTYLQQNTPLSLIGFPSDAENQLTDNGLLSPSITNGSISSIRNANGHEARLFQTDADASQGNSGGPAVNEFGQAVGVVTYRFKDDNAANAAKSYARDISGLKNLIAKQKINLNTTSVTQAEWEKGLSLAQKSRFSEALEKYQNVQRTYPAHRLAGIYSTQAQTAVIAGKDVSSPQNLAVSVAAGLSGGAGVIMATALLTRHHKNHRHYRNIHKRPRHVLTPTEYS